jgi:hypothetical protein
MAGESPTAPSWEELKRRVERLQQENRRLESRGRLAGWLQAVLVLGIIGRLVVWPPETLTVETMTAGRVNASRFDTDRVYLRSEDLLVTREASGTWASLGSDVPRLWLRTNDHGELSLDTIGAPRLALHAVNSFKRSEPTRSRSDPDAGRPQIELSVAGQNGSPRIVLRDVQGRLIWQAP